MEKVWQILNVLITVAGFLIGIWGAVQTHISNLRNKRFKTVTWEDIHTATKYFWERLKKEGFVPTIIVTPGQRGGIIAEMLNGFYDNRLPIITGFIEPKGNNFHSIADSIVLSTSKWEVFLPASLMRCEDKSDIKLLVVDDFVMSGDFLSECRKKFIDLGYTDLNVRSCTVVSTQVAIDAKKGPDYYWKIVDEIDFYFPWGKAK